MRYLLILLTFSSFAQKSHVLTITSRLDAQRHIGNLNSFNIFFEKENIENVANLVTRDFKNQIPINSLHTKNLKSFTRNLKKTIYQNNYDLIYLNGHGGLKRNYSYYDEQAIINSMYLPIKKKKIGQIYSKERFSLNLLHQELLNTKNQSTVLVSSQCHSGAVHYSSFKRKDTCSASSTTWWHVSQGESSHSNNPSTLYIKHLFSKENLDLNGDLRTSLFEGHVNGMIHDMNNIERPRLSSWEFLDYKICNGFTLNKDSAKCFNNKLQKSGYNFIVKKSKKAIVQKNQYIITLLTDQEESRLPIILLNEYEDILNFFKNDLIYSISEIQKKPNRRAVYHTVVQYINFLRKYAHFKHTLSKEDQEKLESLIQCERNFILN